MAFVKTDLRQVKCYMAFVKTDLRQVKCYAFVQTDLRQVKCYMAFVKTDLRQVKCYMALVQTDLRQVKCYMTFVKTDLQQVKLLSLREFRRPYFLKSLGFGFTRLCKTKQINKDDVIGWIVGKLLLNFCLFFEGVVGDNGCSGIFEI